MSQNIGPIKVEQLVTPMESMQRVLPRWTLDYGLNLMFYLQVLRHTSLFSQCACRNLLGRYYPEGLPQQQSLSECRVPTIDKGGVTQGIATGRVQFHPPVAGIEGDRVCFSDGGLQRVQLIVCCTGYDTALSGTNWKTGNAKVVGHATNVPIPLEQINRTAQTVAQQAEKLLQLRDLMHPVTGPSTDATKCESYRYKC